MRFWPLWAPVNRQQRNEPHLAATASLLVNSSSSTFHPPIPSLATHPQRVVQYCSPSALLKPWEIQPDTLPIYILHRNQQPQGSSLPYPIRTRCLRPSSTTLSSLPLSLHTIVVNHHQLEQTRCRRSSRTIATRTAVSLTLYALHPSVCTLPLLLCPQKSLESVEIKPGGLNLD